jgi:prepilin-type N-terminal cleavage/methylation domain-containing protein
MTLPRHNRAFTIVELLVVLAIIVIVAGLVVGLTNVASARKKISRTEVELQKLVTMIEAYKAKVGVYPPDNTNNPALNSLLYELAGARRTPPDSNPTYETPFDNARSNELFAAFGVTGVINASDDPVDIRRFVKQFKGDQMAELQPGTLSIVVPVEGPDGPVTAWRYLQGGRERSGIYTNRNPESFDLWVDINVGGQMRTIGNWKN